MSSLIRSIATSYRGGGLSGTLRAVRRRVFGVKLSVATVNELAIDIRALSNREPDDVAFFRGNQSTGISGLAAFRETHEQVGNVTTTTLRRAMTDHAVDDVDVLKIDAEGYDKLVLEGFPWAGNRPRLIICESEDAKTVPLGYRYTDLVEMLQGKGLKVIVSELQPIIKYGGDHRWVGLQTALCRLFDGNAWGNLLARRDPDDYDWDLQAFADTAARLGLPTPARGTT